MGRHMAITKLDASPGKPLHPLYHRYSGENNPQEAFISVQPEHGCISADWNGNIGSSVASNVWHRREFMFLVSPELTAQEINDLMEEIQPLADILYDGFSSDWDGSNYVGELNEDAQAAHERISEICGSTVTRSGGVWDASDWMQAGVTGQGTAGITLLLDDPVVITPETSDEEIDSIESRIEEIATGDGVTLNGLFSYLMYLRTETREVKRDE